jgi:hypothetical protein
VAKDSNPSGLPSDHIATPNLGFSDSVFEGHSTLRPDGIRRIRNFFLVLSLVVGASLLAVLIFGNADSAGGMTIALLAPLLFFLLVSQLLGAVAGPRNSR